VNLRCAIASEWKAPISTVPSSWGVMLNTGVSRAQERPMLKFAEGSVGNTI
jgi:hypothetical protein